MKPKIFSKIIIGRRKKEDYHLFFLKINLHGNLCLTPKYLIILTFEMIYTNFSVSFNQRYSNSFIKFTYLSFINNISI